MGRIFKSYLGGGVFCRSNSRCFCFVVSSLILDLPCSWFSLLPSDRCVQWYFPPGNSFHFPHVLGLFLEFRPAHWFLDLICNYSAADPTLPWMKSSSARPSKGVTAKPISLQLCM